jgi:hypothetical protein
VRPSVVIRPEHYARARVTEFARSIAPDRLSRTGQHRTFGEITVADYLRIDLDHDREHVKDLKDVIERLRPRA